MFQVQQILQRGFFSFLIDVMGKKVFIWMVSPGIAKKSSFPSVDASYAFASRRAAI